ncbi:protein shisa-2-like [Erythrolamprus reginae]|uniref:protein shisa-2-like n=1 Tax=Erythrolamprus reginae TaxID=121349 RepID=UPI00396C8E09
MENPLPCALLLFLFFLGCTGGQRRSHSRCLDPHGTPLPDDPQQGPESSDASGESSFHRAEISSPGPGPAGTDSRRPRAPLSRLPAEERIPPDPARGSEEAAGIVAVRAERCQQWAPGQGTPVRSFQCPTKADRPTDLFCCGACNASYCCSSRESRLNQTRCSSPPVDPAHKFVLIVAIVGTTFLCICSGFAVFLCRERVEKTRLDNERPGTASELADPADPPMPGPPLAASGNPDLASPGREELPTAGADSPGGPGSPEEEEEQEKAPCPRSCSLMEGDLGAPSKEEEETVL